MDLAMAAMGSLLPKLFELLHGEYKLQKGVKKDVEFLEREMRSIDAALRKVAMVPRDKLDDNSKIWANHVRELSYEMEDLVESFLVGVQGFEPAANPDSFKGFVKKVSNLFTKGKKRHQIADAIKSIKDQVQDVADRRDRYKIDDVEASLAATTIVGPRLMAQFKDQRELVGIEEPRDVLIKRLVDEDDCESKEQLKILSIFGFGGLGKTTLARAVYDKIEGKFDYKAFYSVGQNPNLKNVLIGILSRVDEASCSNATMLDVGLLIEKLRGLLANKRYLIIIDDIWDMSSWDIIKCAFIDSKCGSRVITTTRIFEVAKEASDIYKQEPLSPGRSKELFYMRLSIGKSKNPYYQSVNISEKILQKCGGIPLAIITIASLLASKPVNDWSGVYDSIGFGNENNKQVDNTRKILLYSYSDLPYYPRLCLLHLSIYPEDFEIEKDTLIWKWVAEGYVHEEPGKGLFEIGERYFNVLIDRSMIQAVEEPYKSIIYACRVHDLVLDMIHFVSKEESLATVLKTDRTLTSLHSTGRRLAIKNEVVEQDGSVANMSMQQVRSYNAIRCRFSMLPLLSKFKALRVLALEGCTFLGGEELLLKPEGYPYHLKHVGSLIHLRYIGIMDTPTLEVPEEVGNLRFLQVLDLIGTDIRILPQSVGQLTQLKCLRSPGIGNGMGLLDWTNLTSLEEVWLRWVSPDILKELAKLTELRVFKAILLENMVFKDLIDSLDNLKKLQVIEVDWYREDDEPWSGSNGSVFLGHLRDLTLNGMLPERPMWINSSCLPNLCHLYMFVKAMEAQDMDILGRFPELISLQVHSDDYIVFPDAMDEGAFPKLRCLILLNAVQPKFARGAMPGLEYLQLFVLVRTSGVDFCSLENLPRLEKVDVHIRGTTGTGIDVLQANASLKHAVEIHPNRPTLKFIENPFRNRNSDLKQTPQEEAS